jgi:hypothetical protein
MGLCIHVHSGNVGVQLGILYGWNEHDILHSKYKTADFQKEALDAFARYVTYDD